MNNIIKPINNKNNNIKIDIIKHKNGIINDYNSKHEYDIEFEHDVQPIIYLNDSELESESESESDSDFLSNDDIKLLDKNEIILNKKNTIYKFLKDYNNNEYKESKNTNKLGSKELSYSYEISDLISACLSN